LDTLREGGVDGIVVVTRQDDAATATEARAHAARVVVNPDPSRGMLSSIRSGLRDLASNLSPWPVPVLVTPGDLPGIGKETVRELVRLSGAPGEMAVPVFEGRRGHPLLVGSDFVPEVFDLDDSVGLRQLLERHPEALREIPVEDAGILGDVDTPDDYDRLREKIPEADIVGRRR
ncbi:MAG: nucleotidyltransferase family protein, partial [Thermoanaerobaculia bacterium]|nr:nucleotidyltransferase family protein [Thermoanaerobaculia bacterium]